MNLKKNRKGISTTNRPLAEMWEHLENFIWKIKEKMRQWTSLVVQWLRICLPMQGTQVRTLVPEDPTCCGATKPLHHNY